MKQSEMDPSKILSMESFKKIGSKRNNQYMPQNINFMPFVTLSQSDENSQTLFDSADNSLFQIEEQDENNMPNLHKRIQSNSLYFDLQGKPLQDQQNTISQEIQNDFQQNENIFKKKGQESIDKIANIDNQYGQSNQNNLNIVSNRQSSSRQSFCEPNINSRYNEIALNQPQNKSRSRRSANRKRISVSPERQSLDYQNLNFIQDFSGTQTQQSTKSEKIIKNSKMNSYINMQTSQNSVNDNYQNFQNLGDNNENYQNFFKAQNFQNQENLGNIKQQNSTDKLQSQLQQERKKNFELQSRISQLESQLAESESEKSQIIQRYEDMLSRSQFKLNLNRYSVHASDNNSMTFAHKTDRDSFITPRFYQERQQDRRKYGSVHDHHFQQQINCQYNFIQSF